MRLAMAYRVNLAPDAVCEGHHAPLDTVEAMVFDRPPLLLQLGPRGGGKSYGAAFATHLNSERYPGHRTMILGGSEAQSRQIYHALGEFRDCPSFDHRPIARFGTESCTYQNGSTVEYIAASDRSARGPHVPTLRLDEVDAIDPDIRESAFGMCMRMDDVPGSITMTSTWHIPGGPMSKLMERAEHGDFPLHKFCIFEVLEHCPDSRSGPDLGRCGECPLVRWCHADRDTHGGLPRAKRSAGHYSIDSLIQKVKGLSERVFESDFLCSGPKSEGAWFTQFSDANISESAEYDPFLPYWISVDSGVVTGAVLAQFREAVGNRPPSMTVFGEYLADGTPAEIVAAAIDLEARGRCGGHAHRRVCTDHAGGARNPVGPPVIEEYRRAGLTGDYGLETWVNPPGSVIPQLTTVEGLVRSADGTIGLHIHPRCKHLIAAMRAYRRATIRGQILDHPADPQHPAEDMVDALRGVVSIVLPEGRQVPKVYASHAKAGRVF